jgi:hypothetical protein
MTFIFFQKRWHQIAIPTLHILIRVDACYENIFYSFDGKWNRWGIVTTKHMESVPNTYFLNPRVKLQWGTTRPSAKGKNKILVISTSFSPHMHHLNLIMCTLILATLTSLHFLNLCMEETRRTGGVDWSWHTTQCGRWCRSVSVGVFNPHKLCSEVRIPTTRN